MAVPVVFAIGQVVALGIADQIVQGETVVSGDKVDAAVRASPARVKFNTGAGQTLGQGAAAAPAL